jgi:hypothetical protein
MPVSTFSEVASFGLGVVKRRLRFADKLGIFEEARASLANVWIGGADKVAHRSSLSAADTNPVFHRFEFLLYYHLIFEAPRPIFVPDARLTPQRGEQTIDQVIPL